MFCYVVSPISVHYLHTIPCAIYLRTMLCAFGHVVGVNGALEITFMNYVTSSVRREHCAIETAVVINQFNVVSVAEILTSFQCMFL